MDVFDFSSPLPARSSVVTVGVYDGVHIGHRFTLQRVIEVAKATGRTSVVATFDRHPAYVVRPETAPLMLCDLDQRLELLEEVGIDVVAVIAFTPERSREMPEEFVEQVLVDGLGAGEIMVGENFHFGRDRRGDVALLAKEGKRLGIEVSGVHLEAADGDVVSSTRIRQLIAEGEMTHSMNLLGRVHELRGQVVRGDGRGGRELGFPTANLETAPNLAAPGEGIYAGWYRDDDHTAMPAAISVGRRPTFYDSAEPLIEAYIMDFDADLYGAHGRVSFGHRLRNEERFDDVDALITQMKRDVDQARQFCAAHMSIAPKTA